MSKTKLQTSMEVLEAAFKSGTFDPGFCLDVITRADTSEKIAKAAKKRIQSLLQFHFESTVASLYKDKNSDTGTVSQYVGMGDDVTHELSVERNKKVEWNQEHLENVLIAAGRSEANMELSVSKFINKKYTISEKDYAKFNDNQKEIIDTGRSIKAGPATFTIKERKTN